MRTVFLDPREITAAMGIIAATAGKAPSYPVLETALLETTEHGVVLTGTDLRTTVRCVVECHVESQGAVAFNARKCHQILREIPSGPITISLEGNGWVTIKGPGTFRLPGTVADQFPAVAVPPDEYAPIDTCALARLVSKVSFAAGKDESRMYLCGVFAHHAGGELTFVATDGHRLSAATERLSGVESVFGDGVIVPANAMKRISRILTDATTDSVEIATAAGRLFVRSGGVLLDVLPLDGTYPNWRQMLSGDRPHTMVVGMADVRSALRRVSLLSDSDAHAVDLGFQAGELIISVSGGLLGGDANEQVPGEFEGPVCSIRMNAQYLLDAIKVCEGEQLRMDFGGPLSPVVFSSEDVKGDLHLVMPMRAD